MNYLHITTQHMEDYNFDGSHPRFKFKGGDTYVILEADARTTDVADLLQRFRGCIEQSGSFQSYISSVKWVSFPNDGCSEWEPPILVIDMDDHFLFNQKIMREDFSNGDFRFKAVATRMWKQVVGSDKRLDFEEVPMEEAIDDGVVYDPAEVMA